MSWIRMRGGLLIDPKVAKISKLTNLSVDTVIGKLFRIWSYLNGVTRDEVIPHFGLRDVDKVVKRVGFAAAMATVDWLRVEGEGVRFPGYRRKCRLAAPARKLQAQQAARKRWSKTRQEEPPPAPEAPSPPSNGSLFPDMEGEKETKSRPRDLLFDAIVEVTGSPPSSHVGKVAATLRLAEPPFTPEEVRRFPAAVAAHQWSCAITLALVEKHMGIVRQEMPAAKGFQHGPTRQPSLRYDPARDAGE